MSDAGTAMNASNNFRAGFVAILGKPNVGKSTLVNLVLGEKIAAVSGLPQTTRDRMNAIHTTESVQIIFVDMPGLVEATDKLNEALRDSVVEGLGGVDCVLHMIDVNDPQPVNEDMAALLRGISTPIVCAVNKIDTQPKDYFLGEWLNRVPPPFDVGRYADIVAISATTGAGRDDLLLAVTRHMPPGPPLYDPEQLTDRNMRFLAAELIREKVFQLTHQEIPYSTAVTIDAFEEREAGKWYIAATIHVERDSQKGIVIGKGGEMMKKISRAARLDIERLVDHEVYLELFVKVSRNWRKSEMFLREFGYSGKKRR